MTSRQVQATLNPSATAGAAPASSASRSASNNSATRSSSSSSASRSTGTPEAAPAATGGSTGRKLPKTASDLPLIGAIGVALLVAGACLTALRRRRES